MPCEMFQSVRVLLEAEYDLAEGPVYRQSDDSLTWVDITAGTVHRLNLATNRCRNWDMGEMVGFVCPINDDRWIAGPRSGLARIKLSDDGRIHRHPLEDRSAFAANLRYNDGAVGPDGTLWYGDMSISGENAAGSIYRFGPKGGAVRVLEGFTVPNGPAIDPEGTWLAFNETAGGVRSTGVYRCAILTDGRLGEERPWIDYTERDGSPDGLCFDRNGNVWVAEWGGWGLTRFDPEGRVSGRIDLPVPLVTKPVFGGPDGQTLFVTTARHGMDAEDSTEAPLSGSIFAVDDVRPGGPPAPAFHTHPHP